MEYKEININIEGYNVNGICVGCLNYNRKMFYDDDVKECFRIIADIDVPDGLAIQVCWECLAAVKRVIKFRARILYSYDVLIDYSNQHMFLNAPEEFTIHATTSLEVTHTETYDIDSTEYEEDMKEEIKQPLLDLLEFETDSPQIKEETAHEDDNFSENISQDFSQDAEPKDEVLSEDDVQLSKLKKRKDKKVKRDKKKLEKRNGARKLRNLPADVVEILILTEEEMWKVREEDSTCEVFQKTRFKCELCLLSFNTKKLKEYHVNGKHKPKSENALQCDICKGYFITKDNLSIHRQQHLSAYKCKECGLVTTLKRVMLKHLCCNSNIGIGIFNCGECDKVFNTKSKLTYHRNMCHQERPQCDCCGKVFANKLTLKQHLKLLPQNVKPKEKLYLPCKGCDKVFNSKKSYRAHVVIHDGLTYPCPICGKLFQWKRNLSRHTRAHRERDAGALHECRECGKTFSSRDCYNNHMKLSKKHVNESNYTHECDYCGKKFPTKWCLVDHIDWDHLKTIKYQCSVCFKAFKTAKIMVAHMNNIHQKKKLEDEGDHLCEICGKSYKTVKRLKGHVWAMHKQRSMSKSYKCKLCAATFTWQTSIYKHMKMMHDTKRTKPPRAPPVKKPDTSTYPDMDLANRLYFHQNIATISQNTQLPSLAHPNII